MAKSKLTETKKITHKLAVEGELTLGEDNLIVINIPDEGVKNLNELLNNFEGCYVKLSITEESVEDVVDDDDEQTESEE
jgi:hypothetical protein